MRQAGGGLEAVIFDFDGVIVDSEPYWDLADRRIVEEHGVPFRPGTRRLVMGLRADESIGRLAEIHRIDVPTRILARRRERLMAGFYRERIPLRPGVRSVLRGLGARDLPAAIATSTPAALVRIALRRFGLERSFAALATADEVERGKPAPDVFLLAARRLGAAPERCLVVEDSAVGVRAARAAGMPSVWFRNPHAPDARGEADFEITRAAEIVTLVDRQNARPTPSPPPRAPRSRRSRCREADGRGR